MTDIGNHDSFSADEMLAAEYALGVLAGTEREAAARRVARERAFATLVAKWEERLAPWAAEIPELAPPPHQPGTSFAHEVLGISVLAQIFLDFNIIHQDDWPAV